MALVALLTPSAVDAADVALTTPFELRPDGAGAPAPTHVRLRGVLDLGEFVRRHPQAEELSGLAWDADDEILYAVTDRGHLLHLRPRFHNERLVDVRLLDSFRLKAADGARLRGKHSDAEGLDGRRLANGIRGDAELVVSFERDARIARFDPRGRQLGTEPLALALRTPARYASGNKGLEAVTVHPHAGVLTAPEFPLTDTPADRVTLYGAAGEVGTFARLDARNAAVVALESLPDGRILVMERAFSWWTVSLRVVLRLLDRPGNTNTRLAISPPVLDLDSAQGWQLDNFEGLARHRDLRFFMASDNNGQSYQKTLLAYFEIIDVEL